MRTRSVTGYFVVCCLAMPMLCACEEEKPPATKATASEPPAPVPTPTPTAVPAPPAAKTNERPAKVDTALTPARRAAIEAKYAAVKGFLSAAELETKLKANKALKDKKAAIAAFDKLARGKWVLFTGPIVNLTEDGFDIGFEYTPQLPNDPMGMSRQFFEVTMSKVEGYAKDGFKDGNMGVVLAKYEGNGKAAPGYELIATEVWK